MAMARYGDSSTGGGGAAVPVAPAAAAQPQLGYGSPSAATIDQVNIWMRSTPWYQQLLRSWGQDPGHPHNLTDAQKTAIIRGAQAHGVIVDEGSQEIDDNGNFQNQGHKLRNTLIVAGIAAATIATMGAAGVFAGAGAAGGAAAGGVEAGAAAGLDASVASGALAGGAGAGLGTAGAAGAAGATLASTALPTATGTVAGGTGLTAAGLAGDGSVIGGAAGAGSTAAGVAAGGGIGDAVLRYGIPSATNIISSLIGANAAGNASDAQQKYLQEALDYEKSRDAAAIALEGSRYSNYSGNIAPYLATGASANARMASLLGLPAAPTGYGPGGPASSNTATPPLTYTPSATSTTAGATIGAPTAPVTTGAPLPRVGTTVTMRAPDGSTQAVPADQVDHWKSLGATVLSGAA